MNDVDLDQLSLVLCRKEGGGERAVLCSYLASYKAVSIVFFLVESTKQYLYINICSYLPSYTAECCICIYHTCIVDRDR